MNNKITTLLCAFAIHVAIAFPSYATLTPSYSFNGNGSWSLDGCGGNNTPTSTIAAIVPSGSIVEAAFLYSTMHIANQISSVSFDGTIYSGADWASLGSNSNLEAYRTDATAYVSTIIGGGNAAPYSFAIDSESPSRNIDCQALANVYGNPLEALRTIAFLDGASSSTGDSAFIALAAPLTLADLAAPSFEAMLSLGIGYISQAIDNSQSSTVDVNGSNLTTCAGGSDDGVEGNGGLITIGGIGDSSANDHGCNINDADDELYSLNSFLNVGDSLIQIDTLNPSGDDNIFFAGLSITSEAVISDKPTMDVPAPSSLALLGLGMLSLSLRRRTKQ